MHFRRFPRKIGEQFFFDMTGKCPKKVVLKISGGTKIVFLTEDEDFLNKIIFKAPPKIGYLVRKLWRRKFVSQKGFIFN